MQSPCGRAERAFQALDQAVDAAFVNADIRRRPVDTACMGMAGIDRPDDLALVREWADKVRLASIVEITMTRVCYSQAVRPDGWGVAISPEPARSPLAGRATDASIARAVGVTSWATKAARMES